MTEERPWYVVSPHLDDAVLSLGQTIAAHPGTTILTVLAGVPGELPLTHYDAKRGFMSGRQAVESRQREDHRACAVVDATPVHLGFFDSQYGVASDTAEIVDRLRSWLGRQKLGVRVFAPVGLRHPDHDLVARCVRAVIRRPVDELFLYEELPARVWWPEDVPPVLARIEREGWTIGRVDLPAERRLVKAAAVACYRSQFDDLADPAFLVPERVWRATRTEPEPTE